MRRSSAPSLGAIAPPIHRKETVDIMRILVLAITLLFAFCQSAEAWWNDDWQLRKKITIDTSASGANISDAIGTTAVLVRLHVGNFRFAQAKEDGSDLRFVGPDDKTPLKHHVEKYDSLLGEAFVWVQVPDVKPGTKSDIWLYYSNKKAISSNDAKGTYDADTLLVYHFAERGTPALDSSVWANGAQSAGQPADGAIIGTGLRLDGQMALTLPAAPSLAFAQDSALTLSLWMKPAAAQPNAQIYSRHDGQNGLVVGLDNGSPYVEVTNAGTTMRSAPAAAVSLNSWHHLGLTAASGVVTLYIDGNPYASLNAAVPALNSVATIGRNAVLPVSAPTSPGVAPSAGTTLPGPTTGNGAIPADGASAPAAEPASGAAANGSPNPEAAAAAPPVAAPVPAAVVPPPAAAGSFVGDVDEFYIAKAARPSGWIKAVAIGQGPDQAKLISFSVDEETASWLSGYFAVILRSVTIDGWVVIGVLLVLAVISWFVMVDKASFLSKQARANDLFMKSFRKVAADLTALDRGDANEITTLDKKMMRNSSLYHIYHVGASEIAHRLNKTENGRARILSGPSIAAIRASLDASLLRETQKLNRLMVVLTIAISGGPFLGLLGTVVGVMITFAAIAASGDVNVNAIAPGIAAALVATVAGLGVAIPALFGYNYLISRIKDLTGDMQVFVDEFVTKMAEFYSDRPEHPQPYRVAAE